MSHLVCAYAGVPSARASITRAVWTRFINSPVPCAMAVRRFPEAQNARHVAQASCLTRCECAAGRPALCLCIICENELIRDLIRAVGVGLVCRLFGRLIRKL